MTHRNSHNERVERIANQLADSVFGLSDNEILAEIGDSGANPDQEAERTDMVLRDASEKLENLNRRLADLGHTFNQNSWRRGWSGYRNTCETCGSFVSFEISTGQMRGDALDRLCSERDQFVVRRWEASRK
jgi:hypothetical protein